LFGDLLLGSLAAEAGDPVQAPPTNPIELRHSLTSEPQ
jgi:hypothetical protein